MDFQYAPGSASSVTRVFDTRTDAAAASISSAVDWILVGGYATPGLGAAGFKRVVTLTTADCGFQSADGAYWQIAERILRPEMFSDDATSAAINLAIKVANDISAGEVRLGNRNYRASVVSGQTYCIRLYGSVSLIGEAGGYKDGFTAGTGTIISWGSNVANTTRIALWETGSPSIVYHAQVRGIQFMPDGFTSTATVLASDTFYASTVMNVAAGSASVFSHCTISDCMFGPTRDYALNFDNSAADWASGIITHNFFFAGILAVNWLDNNTISHNSFNGVKLAMDITQIAGAGNLLIEHNNGIAAGGALYLRKGYGPRIIRNYFELAQTYNGSGGYLYNIVGTGPSPITQGEFKNNICVQLGDFGLTGLVYMDYTTNMDIDGNDLRNDGAVAIAGFVFTDNNVTPKLGEMKLGSNITPTTGTRPGYTFTTPATVKPYNYDIPLTLATGSADTEVPSVRKDRNGVCTITGSVTGATTTTGTTVFTLPSGFCPTATIYRVVQNNTGAAIEVSITSGGVFKWESTASNTRTGLACTFMAQP